MSNIEGAYTAEKILPDGADHTTVVNPFTGEKAKARKGIVAATLNNIALLNRLLTGPLDANREQVHLITDAVEQLIPSLKGVGIFNLFSIEEWLNDKQQQGRIYVAILYLKHNPEVITEQVKSKLKEISDANLSDYLCKEIQRLGVC